jgi:hypothetical protein
MIGQTQSKPLWGRFHVQSHDRAIQSSTMSIPSPTLQRDD